MARLWEIWYNTWYMVLISMDYLAGFIDGEGSIGIWKRKRNGGRTIDWTPYISIVNTNREIIENIANTIGGTVRTHKASKGHFGKKTIYSLQYSHKKAREIAKKIYPYLYVKKEQARILAVFPACSGTFAPIDMLNKKEEQERLYWKFKQLNGKVVL